MLTILDVDVPTGSLRDRTLSLSVSYCFSNLKALVSPEVYVSRANVFRSPCDSLNQGDAFDKFGNKSVSNFQIDGILRPKIVINGEEGLPLKWNGNFHLIEASFPPTVKKGSYHYALVQVSPIHIYGWYMFQGKKRISTVDVFPIGSGENVTIGYVTYYDILDKKGNVESSHYTTAVGGMANAPTIDTTYVQAMAAKNGKRDPSSVDYRDGSDAIVETLSDVTALRYYAGLKEGATLPGMTRVSVNTVEMSPVTRHSINKWCIYLRNIVTHHFPSPPTSSSEARELVEKLNSFDSNMLAYGSDLRKTGDTIRTLLKLPRDFKNPKAWASAWLSGRYGDRLTVSDTKELLESIQKRLARSAPYSLARSSRSVEWTEGSIRGSTTRTRTLVVADDSYNGVMTAVNNLMKWDVWPTLENTWDMIPLSFVVDWILPVSDILGQIDAAVQAPYLRPLTSYDGTQTRATFEIPADDQQVAGTLQVKYYTRKKASILSDIRPFEADINFLPSFSVINVGDALALSTTLPRRR